MNCDTRYIIFDKVETALKQIIAHLNIKSEEVERYNEIITYLGKIMEENYKLAKKKAIGESYAVQLLDMSRTDEQTLSFLKWLKEEVAASNNDIKKSRAGRLIKTILDTKEFWIKSDNPELFRPVNVLIEFMENEFSFLREMTLEKFAEIYFGADNIAEGIESIFHILMAKGALMAKPHTTFSHWQTWVRHCYITVPNGIGSIPDAIKKQASINGISQVTSTDLNNISYINVICGLPSYAFDDISDYERKYEDDIENASGLHIVENTEKNLINLPPLISKNSMSFLKISNQREMQYLKNYEAVIEKYLSIGIIWKIDFTYYSYFIPENSSLNMEEIEAWCCNVYLEHNHKPSLYEFKQEFNKEFLDENRNLKSIIIDIDRLYLQDSKSEHGLQKFMRYYMVLTKNLDSLFRCFKNCMQMIENAIKNNQKQHKLIKATKRYYQYIYLGILKQVNHSDYGEIIVLTDEKGEDFILCYEEDFNSKEKQMSIYNSCRELYKCDQEKTDHESGINANFLMRLDEFADEKMKDRSGMVERRRNKEYFTQKLEIENKLVLSLEMKNYLGDKLKEVKNVYDSLYLMI